MRKIKSIVLLLAAVIVLASCGTTSTVPITGRKQNLLVTDSYVLGLSNSQYQEYMKTAKVSTNAANIAMVKRVGQRLANAVETYLKSNNLAAEVKNYAWEFNLVNSNEANAFCMPGGKIVVYEGILPYTKTEAGLAIVLGHEIAHAVAKHSAEQLSKQMRAQYGAQALSAILSNTSTSAATSAIASQAFSFGANSLLRKYSRDNESEADFMGLVFAAMAGYDPAEAVTFWQRMSAGNTNSIPEFFSDHPSDAKRIAAIQKELPEVMKYYKPQATTKVASVKTTAAKKTTASTKKTTTTSAKKKTVTTAKKK
ncbi:MAG: M48 family metallopeptidase [Bacteroidaceae bacterium]|nr:M48 family metallopeptidase [Bacteroidaceae bacterium]